MYSIFLKKKLVVLTKFCAIWIHIQYSSEIQDFSSLYWQVVERQDHCVINNILSHVQSSKVGEEMYNSHHSYCSIYHYSEIYLLLLLQVGRQLSRQYQKQEGLKHSSTPPTSKYTRRVATYNLGKCNCNFLSLKLMETS